jgi:hypothetical protein
MSADDDTPPGRPRRARAQTSTERDIEGLTARAARHAAHEASLESERSRIHREAKARRTHPRGVAVQSPPDMVERELSGTIDVPDEHEREITQPLDMLRRQLDEEEYRVVARMKRESDDPLTQLAQGQFNLAKEIRALRLKDRSSNEEQANQILELIKHPPNEAVIALQEDTERIWRAFAEMGSQIGTPHTESKGKGTVWESVHRSQTLHRWATWLGGVALTAALGSVTYVVASIRASGADEVLRAQDRHDIDELKQELKEARRTIERLKDKTP